MQYAAKGMASIQKISTPWNVVRQGNRIVSAFPEGQSTVDFMGEVGEDAESICFEAKQSTHSAFPLDNYEPHQIEFMRRWRGHKFTVMEWVKKREIYRVPFELTVFYWDRKDSGGRKSIPYSDMEKEWLVTSGRGIVLDYLNGVI
jgi:recombination protein U